MRRYMRQGGLRLISLFLLLVLLAACGRTGEATSAAHIAAEETETWNDTIRADLDALIGETIPYIALDQDGLVGEFYADDVYQIYDGAAENLLDGYGDKLEAAGYDYNPYESTDGEVVPYYEKRIDDRTLLSVGYWFEEPVAAEEEADLLNTACGNIIVVLLVDEHGAYFSDYEQTKGWPAEVVDGFMSRYGSDVKLPRIRENAVWYYRFPDEEASYLQLVTKGDYADDYVALFSEEQWMQDGVSGEEGCSFYSLEEENLIVSVYPDEMEGEPVLFIALVDMTLEEE